MKVVGNVLARTRAKTFISTVVNGGCLTGRQRDEEERAREQRARDDEERWRTSGHRPYPGPLGPGTNQPSLRPFTEDRSRFTVRGCAGLCPALEGGGAPRVPGSDDGSRCPRACGDIEGGGAGPSFAGAATTATLLTTPRPPRPRLLPEPHSRTSPRARGSY